MRHITVATFLALAIASTFSLAPAKAEFGGPVANGQGQCRSYGPNNQNLSYYYWDSCPGTLTGPHGHVRVIGATVAPIMSHHHYRHHG